MLLWSYSIFHDIFLLHIFYYTLVYADNDYLFVMSIHKKISFLANVKKNVLTDMMKAKVFKQQS
jgi:hypothetical protein